MLSSSFLWKQQGKKLQGKNLTFYLNNLTGSEDFESIHPFSKSKPKRLNGKISVLMEKQSKIIKRKYTNDSVVIIQIRTEKPKRQQKSGMAGLISHVY